MRGKKTARLSPEEFARRLREADAWYIKVEPDNNLMLHTIKDHVVNDWLSPDWRKLSSSDLSEYTILIGRLMVNPLVMSRRIK